jgi:hypothetical protein
MIGRTSARLIAAKGRKCHVYYSARDKQPRAVSLTVKIELGVGISGIGRFYLDRCNAIAPVRNVYRVYKNRTIISTAAAVRAPRDHVYSVCIGIDYRCASYTH